MSNSLKHLDFRANALRTTQSLAFTGLVSLGLAPLVAALGFEGGWVLVGMGLAGLFMASLVATLAE